MMTNKEVVEKIVQMKELIADSLTFTDMMELRNFLGQPLGIIAKGTQLTPWVLALKNSKEKEDQEHYKTLQKFSLSLKKKLKQADFFAISIENEDDDQKIMNEMLINTLDNAINGLRNVRLAQNCEEAFDIPTEESFPKKEIETKKEPETPRSASTHQDVKSYYHIEIQACISKLEEYYQRGRRKPRSITDTFLLTLNCLFKYSLSKEKLHKPVVADLVPLEMFLTSHHEISYFLKENILKLIPIHKKYLQYLDSKKKPEISETDRKKKSFLALFDLHKKLTEERIQRIDSPSTYIELAYERINQKIIKDVTAFLKAEDFWTKDDDAIAKFSSPAAQLTFVMIQYRLYENEQVQKAIEKEGSDFEAIPMDDRTIDSFKLC